MHKDNRCRGNRLERSRRHRYGYYGGAIDGNVSSPIIRRNIFRNNHSSGDIQYSAGVISFINGSSPIIENNLFEGNLTRAINLRLPKSGNPAVMNNTFVGNKLAIFANEGIFRNNLIVGNEGGVYTRPEVFEHGQ